MRIISGIFRGKKILFPIDANTRPLKDITKESIFNIIIHSKKIKVELKNSRVLDLFSGVGSFGLECISRGADHVTLVENYNKVIPILKKNLSNIGKNNNFKVIEQDVIKTLKSQNLPNKFDIIFLDPPYKNKYLREILLNIFDKKLLKPDGILIIHRHKNSYDKFIENFEILEEKKYGISKIIFGKFTYN